MTTSISQTSVLFSVTDGQNSVSLAWNKASGTAEFVVQLGAVAIQPTMSPTTLAVQSRVPLDSIQTARDLATWIITTIPKPPTTTAAAGTGTATPALAGESPKH